MASYLNHARKNLFTPLEAAAAAASVSITTYTGLLNERRAVVQLLTLFQLSCCYRFAVSLIVSLN